MPKLGLTEFRLVTHLDCSMALVLAMDYPRRAAAIEYNGLRQQREITQRQILLEML
jgi:hypothetical protein